jgi:hypothetical protein
MAGDNKTDSEVDRIALVEEVALLGELRMMIRMECCSDLSAESKEVYDDALTAIIDRNAKILA